MAERLVVKNWAVFNRIILLLMHAMMACVIISSVRHGFTVDNSLYMATEILDLFALSVLLILVEAIKNDEKNMGVATRETICLLLLAFAVGIGLFSDFYAWLVQGIAEYRTINYIANFLYYLAGEWSVYRGWRYCVFQKEGKAVSCREWVKRTQAGIFYLAVLLDVVNLFTGIYFTVGADGVYRRTEGSFVQIHLFEQGDSYIIEIKDNGVGFDVNAPKEDGRSHIGLSNTIRRIRMILHGEVEVSSVPGESTCIRIKVPLV